MSLTTLIGEEWCQSSVSSYAVSVEVVLNDNSQESRCTNFYSSTKHFQLIGNRLYWFKDVQLMGL